MNKLKGSQSGTHLLGGVGNKLIDLAALHCPKNVFAKNFKIGSNVHLGATIKSKLRGLLSEKN